MDAKQGFILFAGLLLIIVNFWTQGYLGILWKGISAGSPSAYAPNGSKPLIPGIPGVTGPYFP